MSYPLAFPEGRRSFYVPPLKRNAEIRLRSADAVFSVDLDEALDLGFIVPLPGDRYVPMSPEGVSYGARGDVTRAVSVLLAAHFPEAFSIRRREGGEEGNN